MVRGSTHERGRKYLGRWKISYMRQWIWMPHGAEKTSANIILLRSLFRPKVALVIALQGWAIDWFLFRSFFKSRIMSMWKRSLHPKSGLGSFLPPERGGLSRCSSIPRSSKSFSPNQGSNCRHARGHNLNRLIAQSQPSWIAQSTVSRPFLCPEDHGPLLHPCISDQCHKLDFEKSFKPENLVSRFSEKLGEQDPSKILRSSFKHVASATITSSAQTSISR